MWRLVSSAGLAGLLWLGGHYELDFSGIKLPIISLLDGVKIAAGFYVTAFFATGGHKLLWVIYKTLPRDLKAGIKVIQIKYVTWNAQRCNYTVPKYFMDNVAKNPNKTALIFEGKRWSFAEIDAYSNRVANVLYEQGYKHQESIALFMENRPQYVATWLGCSKIGVVTALINFNLRHKPLIHSIKVAKCKGIICGAEMQDALAPVLDEFEDFPIYVSGGGDEEVTLKGGENFDQMLHKSLPIPISDSVEVNFHDNLLYIYTSGTTGLPKAAIIKHARFLFFSTAVHYIAGMTEKDIIYNPLPLYHSAGGMVGMGQVLIYNSAAVIRKKFSVSNYWPEAKEYDCTIAQYVGEICRYLLNSPSKPEDNTHKVRLMYGNGVRPQIWEQFTKRFNIPVIAEFYGATESNANIMNFEGKPGACGFLSILFPSAYPVTLMRVNKETGELVRNRKGLGIPCKPGEPGEFVGKIMKNDPVKDFHGYADKEATEKKIARNVFSKGDYAFLSGDILVMDELGYIYFKDRTGDTFRWRGENVSTTEVEGVVSQVAQHRDAVVYGVEVPGVEGKAGMAAIVDPEETLDLSNFTASLSNYLPSYSQPVFIRILKEIDTTGTFKLKKLNLQKQGYDPNTISDKLYFLDSKKKIYITLTTELYERIANCQVGL